MAYVNSTRVARNGLMDRVMTLKDSLLAAANQRRLYAATVRELSALSERELTDLGISRFDIRQVAHEAAYGK